MIQLANLDPNKLYSYADYFKRKFEERVELIKDNIFPMVAPSRVHQKLCLTIGGRLDNYLHGKSCEVYVAPFDVRLPAKSKTDSKIYNVFQPDVCVICDMSKLDARGCIGAPDIVVEIVSKSNSKRDMKLKFDAYLEAGVLEYWIVSP